MGPGRDTALDAFRGLAVVGMVLVNLQGSFTDGFALLAHAPWHGLTLADLVFPFFLLAVGLATPLALDRPDGGPSAWVILRRGLLLIAIGILLNWLLRPTLDLEALRLTGVLQRIGLVYLACAVAVRLSPGATLPLMAAIAILALHTLILLLVPAPGASTVSLLPGEGISGWLDQVALPGRVLRGTYDPEGVLSTFPAIATGLIGVAVGRRLGMAGSGGRAALRVLGASSLVFLVAGLALTPWLPANKALWTASFALVTAGLGLGCLLVLRWIWPRAGDQAWARGMVLLGRTALTLYVLHMLLIAVLVRSLPDGTRLWDALYGAVLRTGLPGDWASLLFALIASGLCFGLMPLLARRRWLLRV